MICVGLIVMKCFTTEPAPVDSFCSVYVPIVQQKGDGSIEGTSGVKRRILANERTYRQLCGGRNAAK